MLLTGPDRYCRRVVVLEGFEKKFWEMPEFTNL